MLVFESLVFAFLAMLCWGFGDFFIQHSVRKTGDIETMAFLGLLGALILSPLVLPEIFLLFNSGNLVVLFMLGVITLATSLITFEAFKRGKLSVTEVVIELELPITIILGAVFFMESISLTQLAIIGLIFVGLILVATKSFSHYRSFLEKGIFIALIAALLMGATNFLVGASARQLAPVISIWSAWLFTGLVGLLIIFRREGVKKFTSNVIKHKWLVIATVIFDTFAWLFYAFAISQREIGIITAITESYVVIGVSLGLIFNKEKIAPHQIFGCVLAIGASILLALSIV